MKISFIRHFAVADEVIPPLHFGYLASSIPKRHNVKIYDQLRDNDSNNRLIELLIRDNADVIGFSAFTKDISYIMSFVSKLKPLLPNAKIVLGGVQMTLMPVETFEYFEGYIDYGFIGESETAFSIFIDAIDGNPFKYDFEDVPSLVWKVDGSVKVNPVNYPTELDDLPFPAWELMHPISYPKAPHGAFFKQYPVAPIITSRGCPYPCTFCAAGSLSGKNVRYRSLDNVVEEIKLLRNKYEIKEVHIEDDNFSMKKDRVIEFSERVLREVPGVTWAFPNGLRLNNLDLPTLKLMQRAGCYSLNVGVESGNNDVLHKIKKSITRERIREKIVLVKDAGLDIGGFFIIGFPGETTEEIKDTIKFAKDLPLDRMTISYFQPYPGTSEYKKLCDAGEYEMVLDNSKHSLNTISYVNKNLTENKLKSLRFEGFFRFYFRPKIVIKLLKEVRSLEHFKYILKRGLRWLSN